MDIKFRRHGDVNLHAVDKVEGKIVEHNGSYIVARGEATNSTHNITVKNPKDMIIRETENGERYIELLKEAIITHTHDHEPLTIQPGIYKQVQEREVDWFSKTTRKVVD